MQRNYNVIITPLLGFGAQLTYLPLYKYSSNLYRDFIFLLTITISIFPRLYILLILLLQYQIEIVIAVVVMTVIDTRVVNELEVEVKATV